MDQLQKQRIKNVLEELLKKKVNNFVIVESPIVEDSNSQKDSGLSTSTITVEVEGGLEHTISIPTDDLNEIKENEYQPGYTRRLINWLCSFVW